MLQPLCSFFTPLRFFSHSILLPCLDLLNLLDWMGPTLYIPPPIHSGAPGAAVLHAWASGLHPNEDLFLPIHLEASDETGNSSIASFIYNLKQFEQ